MCRVFRLGLRELVDVRTAWVVLGEEREARLVEGRAEIVAEVRFEGDFRRRVEEDVDVRRDEDVESWPAAYPESCLAIFEASNFGEDMVC